MIEFLLENLPQVILVAVGIVAAIATFVASLFKGKTFKKSLSELKEDIELIIPKKNRADYQQKFSEFVKDYFLDEKTGELLEKDIPRNVQEEIDSHRDVALNIQLAYLIPDPEQKNNEVDEYYQARGKLDDIVQAGAAIEQIRQYYELPETATLQDIQKYVDKIVADLKKKIINSDASAQVKKEQVKKEEVKEDGTQTPQAEKKS